MKNNRGSAFPYIVHYSDGRVIVHEGLTKRDYFAAKAMQGFWVSYESTSWPGDEYVKTLSTESYRIADAMLAAREEK